MIDGLYYCPSGESEIDKRAKADRLVDELIKEQSKQPVYRPPILTDEDFKAIKYFQDKFPHWVYLIEHTNVSVIFKCRMGVFSKDFDVSKSWVDSYRAVFEFKHIGTLAECIYGLIIDIQHAIDDCQDGAPDGMLYDVRQGIFVKIEEKQ
jgi:hypothetical protein